MVCRTPGCGAVAPEGEEGRAFCERCGWPLSEGRVTCEPEVAYLRGLGLGQVALCVDNQGLGRMRWELRSLPEGAAASDEAGEVLPHSGAGLNLTLDPARLPSGDTVEVGLRLWDRVGQASYDLREAPPEECWRDVVARIQVKREQYGPLVVPWKTLLFGGEVGMAAVTARNAGEAEIRVTARVTEGYQVEAPGLPRGQSLQATVPGGQIWTLTLFARPRAACSPGTLSLEADGLDPTQIALVPVATPRPQAPQEARVVAIDFGTTKSAVVVFDQQVRGAEPTPLLWRSPGGEETPWLPSLVGWDGDQPTRYGWEVDPYAPGLFVVKRLKMQLRDKDPRVQRSVVYFLRQLLNRVAAQLGGEAFAGARVVFTLPVLDNGPEYQEQRALTLAAALEAGRLHGLREEQVDFYREPECAAVDFFQHLQTTSAQGQPQQPMAPGDWLCVLDMGGGTTDITFVQFGAAADGSLVFDRIHSLGFDGLAGDRIDEEFWRWCLGRWLAAKRLKAIERGIGGPGPVTVEDANQSGRVLLQGESEPMKRDDGVQAMRVLKETMYAQRPPRNQVLDLFTRRENHLTLSPEEIGDAVLAPMANQMFVVGVARSGDRPQQEGAAEGAPSYPSVRNALDSWELLPHHIQFLCLTGGTSQIPDFEEALRAAVLTSPSTRRVVTPDSIRLNVVRGAARRPGLRLQGRLPFDVQIACEPERVDALALGAFPGDRGGTRLHFEPGQRRAVEIRAPLPGESTYTLFAYEVTNRDPDPQGLFLQVQVDYTAQRMLRVRLAWLIHPEEEVLPWTLLQQVPAR